MRPCPNCQYLKDKPTYDVPPFLVVKCNHCSLVFLSNPPDETTLYESYHENTNIGFDEYTQQSDIPYIAELYAINQQRIEWISRSQPSGMLLDIGCGRGYFLKTASDYGFEVEGVDVSETAVESVMAQFSLNATCHTLDDLIRSNKKYDMITMWHVLEHLLIHIIL